MRGIKLSERINYLAMQDEDGDVGVMTLKGVRGYPPKIVSIESKEDFRFWFKQFSTYELAGL